MSRRILVPLDGSETAFKALDMATALAREENGEVLVLHAMPDHKEILELKQYAQAEHMSGPPEWVYESVVAENILEDATKRVIDKGVKTAGKVTKQGDPAKVILDTAKEKDADMIVMGTRGLGELQGLVMGSVAHKVTQLAPCTVVSVK